MKQKQTPKKFLQTSLFSYPDFKQNKESLTMAPSKKNTAAKGKSTHNTRAGAKRNLESQYDDTKNDDDKLAFAKKLSTGKINRAFINVTNTPLINTCILDLITGTPIKKKPAKAKKHRTTPKKEEKEKVPAFAAKFSPRQEPKTKTDKAKPKDLTDGIKVASIEGPNGIRGTVVFCMNGKDKYKNTPPYSAKVLGELVYHDDETELPLPIIKKPFTQVNRETNEPVMYEVKGKQYGGRIFVTLGDDDLTEQELLSMAVYVTKTINAYAVKTGQASRFGSSDLIKVKKDTVDQSIKKYSDIMVQESCYNLLAHSFGCDDYGEDMEFQDPNEHETWGNKNLDIIDSVFYKGKVEETIARRLGLPREWAVAQDEQLLDSDDDNDDIDDGDDDDSSRED